jgi:TRAP-type uncharacterized transport system substrate-binding protein
MTSRVTRSGAIKNGWRRAASRWRKPPRASRFSEGRRAAIFAAAASFALSGLIGNAHAGDPVPAGMVPYDKPVFRNGHLVLWHGPGHGGGASVRAERAIAKRSDFSILVDASEPSQGRLAAEMAIQAQANGLKLQAVSGKTALAEIGKAVAANSADLAIVPLDALIAAAKNPPDWKARAPMIARLGSEPIEIVAPRTITDIAQLAGRKVSIEASDSASAASAALLFGRLDIAPKFSNQSLPDGLDDLATGKVDALVAIGARASKNLAEFGHSGNFHLLALPWTPAVAALYSPARLASADYPFLIHADESVNTLSAGMALLALNAEASSAHEEKLGPFVTQFLTHFDSLGGAADSAAWRDVNLAAGADSWPRIAVAAAWVDQGAGDRGHALDSFKAIAQAAAASDQGPSSDDSDKLYDSLMKWRAAQ